MPSNWSTSERKGIIEGIFLGAELRPPPAAECSLYVRQLYSELPNAPC